IPDLYYDIELLLTETNKIAARLNFKCTPISEFMGIPINGKTVNFSEHVFYKLEGGKINDVLSIIDTDAIRKQVAV
uniref:ester cyclase n=1 Tax=Pedobacter sp. TaxID=1411316 RepID=UPI003D7F770D